MHIEDTNGSDVEKYGNISALTNGIQIRVQDDTGTLLDLTDGLPIKSNAHWGRFCYDDDIKDWGSGNEFVQGRWTFSKAGAPIRLDGNTNRRLEILLDDSFTGLIDHTFNVQGIWENYTW